MLNEKQCNKSGVIVTPYIFKIKNETVHIWAI